MKQLKKTIISLVMALLLAVTLIPSTNVTVQAASVGKVTGIKAVYTKGKTKLTWKKASRAKKYEIYRSTNGKKFKKVKTVKVSKKKSYSFQITKNGKKKLKKGTYYVQVAPKVKFGNKTYSSDVSTVASAYVYK